MGIKLVRLDFRLIHGQVVTKWVKSVDAKQIVIINNMLAKDEFMANVYKMAAPSGVLVNIYGIDDGIKKYKENGFGDTNTIVLFKSVDDAYQSQKGGLQIESLQIGGLGGGPGRINTSVGISFDAKDIEQLREIDTNGTKVYIQVVPNQSKYEFENIVEKIQF